MSARAAIYLDANAGLPLVGEAASALDPAIRSLTGAANPSSPHALGRQAKALLRQARGQVARSIGDVAEQSLVFMSSGTEAAQTAIRAELEPALLRGEKPHWILGAGDHDAHHQLVPWLRARGGSVSFLPLTTDGAPELDRLEACFRPETRLVSLVWVGNETGVITDVARLARLCTSRDIPLALDAAQAWGKLPLELEACGAAWVSFSGHKIGALAGTGVLWRRGSRGVTELPKGSSLILGKQEHGMRGGTENLLGIATLGAAAARLDPRRYSDRVRRLRDRLEARVLEEIPGARIHGIGAPRVANTSNFGFEGIEKAGLVAALDLAGYCVSPGSACSSGVTEPSRVLMAMGLSAAQASSAVRVSLGEGTTEQELDGFVQALARVVTR